jgi:hypothetical protein
VKVRFKKPGESAADPATEVSAALSPAEVAKDAASADADTRWPVGIATLGKLLRRGAYAEVTDLPTVRALLEGSAGGDVDRKEALRVLDAAEPLLQSR